MIHMRDRLLKGVAQEGDAGYLPVQQAVEARAEMARIAAIPVDLLPAQTEQVLPLERRNRLFLRVGAPDDGSQRRTGGFRDMQKVDVCQRSSHNRMFLYSPSIIPASLRRNEPIR